MATMHSRNAGHLLTVVSLGATPLPLLRRRKEKKNSLLLWFAAAGKTKHYIRSLALPLTKPKAETKLLETASVPSPSANRLASHNITQVMGQPRNDIAAQNNSAAHTSAASGPWIPQFRLRAAERAAVLVI